MAGKAGDSVPANDILQSVLAEHVAIKDGKDVPAEDKKDTGKPMDEDEEPKQDDIAKISREVDVGIVKKKKKKSKAKSKRGLNAPTGFEEYYVDVPVTPEEHVEEKIVYDNSIPFTERIQTAIQRYIAKRKFDSTRKDLWDKYMSYGGVDSGPKMFSGGLDAKTIEDSTAAEIATLAATNFVGDDKIESHNSKYVVDFDGVAKGFFSSWLPRHFDLSSEEKVKSHTSIIRNFLNYLLHHDVCPEYQHQINAARETCDIASKQLWGMSQAQGQLPGEFNKACSLIYGGRYQQAYVGDREWAKDIKIEESDFITPERAVRVFKAGLAAFASDEVIEKYNRHVSKGKSRVIEEFETGLEITEIASPNPEVLGMYKHPSCAGLLPLGQMKVRTWYHPNDSPEDLTEEEEANPALRYLDTYEIWLEETLLSQCFVGMKLKADVKKLSFGIWFLDVVRGVYCSFYSVLPNELMIGWKEHVYLERREKHEPPQLYIQDGEVPRPRRENDVDEVNEDEENKYGHYEQGEDIMVGI